MVTRVHGYPQVGVWFSADVRFLAVTATAGDFVNDVDNAVPDSGLEQAIEAIATRASVIGLNVVDATNFEVMVDYAQAYDDAAVVTEVQDLIDAVAAPVDLSASAITVNTAWVGA